MDDKFNIISIEHLFTLILNDYYKRNEIFGIPEALFFKPSVNDKFSIRRYGQKLETPFGVAAGPQTQLAQNIVSAWLCGARYIELKTIQTLDHLNISKPCIDMQDEGYNCEWSQELKINESYNEYLKAWVIIHVLKHMFKWNTVEGIGTIFNMSVGYNLEGILKDNVQWFFKKMNNCSEELQYSIQSLEPLYPEIKKINIPIQISNNVTLSTMHGCPPDEIEKIAIYLITEKKLHTTVKLNPTLLGADELRTILNQTLKFKTIVPDIAFEHDLKYKDAVPMIKNLQQTAIKNGVMFSIKLTNTLESINHKNIFSPNEKMMYMSGRALHPISINLAKKLQNEFNGKLDISFSAGVDAFNIHHVFNCGLRPITVSSDLLKPGGYGRMVQYIDSLQNIDTSIDTLTYLNQYAERVLSDDYYKNNPYNEPNIKNNQPLTYFDCIHAPCVDACATNQDIPSYMYYTAKGDFQKAYEVILKKNPFPNSLGMVCNHACQTKCTRINYDNGLLIREIKRFVANLGHNEQFLKPQPSVGKKVAIIGAGPSGLSCAYFLRLAGFDVEIYEQKDAVGGMVAHTIPTFRLDKNSFNKDIERIIQLGVRIYFNTSISKEDFEKIRQNCDYTYIAIGAQKFKKMYIENDDAVGVCNPYDFLNRVKKQELFNIGTQVIVVGGGNTAIDVARTAHRLVPEHGNVIVIYRRTIAEMPADEEEIKAILSEGIQIMELTSPTSVVVKNDRVIGLKCIKMKLGSPDSSGRPKPEPIEGSEFELKADLIIPALGQEVVLDFLPDNLLKKDQKSLETNLPNVFIGGDALHNASTFVQAVGDGRKVAEQIFLKENINFLFDTEKEERNFSYVDYIEKKSKRIKGEELHKISNSERKLFNVVIQPLTKEQAINEASRCLLCDEVCSICTTVCPNRANYTYFTEPKSIPLYKITQNKNEITTHIIGALNIQQKYQVLNIGDFCNKCGNCTTFCPTSGKPYKDKPKFYLSPESFYKAEKGFMFNKKEETLWYIENGNTSSLQKNNHFYLFNNDILKATLNAKTYEFEFIEFKNLSIAEYNNTVIAEMMALIDAAKNLY